MRISRIKIENFRNFGLFEINMSEMSAVIVGENSAGKSNLLYALRLVLDPSLPNSARMLEASDFWQGLDKPFAGNQIKVTIEVKDFEADKLEFSSSAECFEQNGTTLSSVITYVFGYDFGIDTGDKDISILTEKDYTYFFCCNENPAKKITDFSFQKHLPLEVLPTLRNVIADLESTRRSPLNRMISRMDIDRDELTNLGKKIDEVIKEILLLPPLPKFQSNITERLKDMMGKVEPVNPLLDFLQTDPDRLLRFLRLFAEGDYKRSLGDIGTGHANIIYLILLLLEAKQKKDLGEHANMLLGVEEPEAHLHPHLQRLVFTDIFDSAVAPVIVTTHSPHIASVAPLRSVIVLRNTSNGTVGRNITHSDLNDDEIKDIQRYLDVTRAELVFSKGIILVEGIAEVILINEYAKKLCQPLDVLGISIINIHGTDFSPYIKLLGSKGLDIPFAIVTDGDPREKNSSVVFDGINRGKKAFLQMYKAELVRMPLTTEDFKNALQLDGIFVGEHTLELDLIDVGYADEFLTVFRELGAKRQSLANTENVLSNFHSFSFKDREKKIIGKIEGTGGWGKGRFAQRLAPKLDANKIPPYIEAALRYMGIEKCK